MKFENKIKFFIGILIVLNLIYIKIARDIRKEISLEYKDNLKPQPINLIENNTIAEDSRQPNKQNQYNNSDSEIVSGLGKSINEGLNPIPIPNNGLIVIDENTKKIQMNSFDFKNCTFENLTISQPEIINSVEKKQTHLITFMSILLILTMFTLFVINYKICQEKRKENLLAYQDGYYLIKD